MHRKGKNKFIPVFKIVVILDRARMNFATASETEKESDLISTYQEKILMTASTLGKYSDEKYV